METRHVRAGVADRPAASPFARPRGLRGRLAGWFMVWTNKQREVADLIGVRPGERVLEVGYGGGALIRLLADRIGDGTVCGVDPSPDMRALAVRRNRRAAAAGRLDLRVGAAEATGFPDGAFDHVVTVNTVAIWPDLEAGLRELHRVTKPGGDVVIAWNGRLRRTDVLDGHGHLDRGQQGPRRAGRAGLGALDRRERPALERRQRARAEPQTTGPRRRRRVRQGVPRRLP